MRFIKQMVVIKEWMRNHRAKTKLKLRISKADSIRYKMEIPSLNTHVFIPNGIVLFHCDMERQEDWSYFCQISLLINLFNVECSRCIFLRFFIMNNITNYWKWNITLKQLLSSDITLHNLFFYCFNRLFYYQEPLGIYFFRILLELVFNFTNPGVPFLSFIYLLSLDKLSKCELLFYSCYPVQKPFSTLLTILLLQGNRKRNNYVFY